MKEVLLFILIPRLHATGGGGETFIWLAAKILLQHLLYPNDYHYHKNWACICHYYMKDVHKHPIFIVDL